MIPVLYSPTETSFTSEGLGRLTECMSGRATEERNGLDEIEFKYPVTGKLYSQLREGCYVCAIHDDAKDVQPFKIYKRSAEINGVVTFSCAHSTYGLNDIVLKPMSASSCAGAFAMFNSMSMNNNPFTFWTDKVVNGTFTVPVPTSVRSVLGGSAGSILDTYGTGEYEWDKWTVKLHLHRGRDTNVEILYGKNMSDLTQEVDITGAYNAIAPYWTDSSTGTVVTLPEGYVMATQATGEAVVRAYDMTEKFSSQPTEAQLRQAATDIVNAGDTWSPTQNLKVSFVQLWQTEEYKNFAPLERLRLCDTCVVKHPKLGISARMKVVKVVYDFLNERYIEMELGSQKATLAQTLSAFVERSLVTNFPTVSMLQQAVDHATQMIIGAKGGHIVHVLDSNGEPQELCIIDTNSLATAVNLWRWNMGGLGFSSTGYNGTYRTAITADGHIVADFIDVGTLTANIIKTGVIQALNSPNYWNLDTGEVYIASYSEDIIDLDGRVTANGTAITANTTAIQQNADGISANATSITTLRGDVDDNTSDIATNTQQIATNTANITLNAQGIAANVTSITTLRSDVDDNTSDIATNTQNIATNTTNIAVNAEGISANSTSITTLDGKVSTNTTNIAANAGNIALNTASINTIDGKVTQNTADILANAGNIALNTASITELDGEVSTNTANIAINSNNISTVDGKVDTNTANIALNTQSITTLNGTVSNHTSSIQLNTEAIESTVSALHSSSRDNNMLLDTYVPSLTKVTAPANRYLSNSSYTNITGDFVEVANLPDVNATHVYRITATAAGNNRGLTFYSGYTFPLVVGKEYRLGCFARVNSGSGQNLRLYGGVNGVSEDFTLTSDWNWCEMVFTCENGNSYVMSFHSVPTAAGAIDMCGFRLEQLSDDYVNAKTAITQNSNSITLTAEQINERIDETNDDISELTLTTENISTRITNVTKSFDGQIEELSSSIKQTAKDIRMDFSAEINTVNNGISANTSEIDKIKTSVVINSNGVTISKENANVKGLFTNDKLSFIDNANTELAWIGAEGLGTPELSIGDANSSTSQWRIVSNGTHLTFTRRTS